MPLVFGMLICMNEKNKAGFFLLEGDGESLAHQKICSFPRLEKSLSPPSTKFLLPPTKQQFSSFNPIKTAFLAVVIGPAPFLC